MSIQRICLVAFPVFILFSMPMKADATCDPCTNCSADPVFVQKDSRNPELVLIARNLKKMGISAGPIDSVAVVEGSSAKSVRIVIFEESGKRLEAEIGRIETLAPAVAAFLHLTMPQTVKGSATGVPLVDPKAFLEGKQP